jgi:hypothetical protein
MTLFLPDLEVVLKRLAILLGAVLTYGNGFVSAALSFFLGVVCVK